MQSFFNDQFLIFFQLILKSFIDVHNGSSLLQYFVCFFEGEAKFVHEVAAEHGGTSRHPSFAMDQHIFFVLEGIVDKLLHFFEEWLNLDIFAILYIDEVVPILKPQCSHTLF